MTDANFKIYHVCKKNPLSKVYKTEIFLSENQTVKITNLSRHDKNKNKVFNKILRLIK